MIEFTNEPSEKKRKKNYCDWFCEMVLSMVLPTDKCFTIFFFFFFGIYIVLVCSLQMELLFWVEKEKKIINIYCIIVYWTLYPWIVDYFCLNIVHPTIIEIMLIFTVRIHRFGRCCQRCQPTRRSSSNSQLHKRTFSFYFKTTKKNIK